MLLEFFSSLDIMNNTAKNKYDAKVKQRALEGKRKLKARKQWVSCVGFPDEVTTSAWLGLVVAIKNTLDLIKYLSENHNYLYLMTRRMRA